MQQQLSPTTKPQTILDETTGLGLVLRLPNQDNSNTNIKPFYFTKISNNPQSKPTLSLNPTRYKNLIQLRIKTKSATKIVTRTKNNKKGDIKNTVSLSSRFALARHPTHEHNTKLYLCHVFINKNTFSPRLMTKPEVK